MIAPYKGTFRISQTWNNLRSNGTLHQGFDLVGIADKRLYSPVYGTVVRAGWENPKNAKQGWGCRVVVRIGKTRFYTTSATFPALPSPQAKPSSPATLSALRAAPATAPAATCTGKSGNPTTTAFTGICRSTLAFRTSPAGRPEPPPGTVPARQPTLAAGRNSYPAAIHNATPGQGSPPSALTRGS